MKRETVQELHIGKDIIPAGRELYPGDFGLTEDRLAEMAKSGQIKEHRPKPRKSKEEEDDSK